MANAVSCRDIRGAFRCECDEKGVGKAGNCARCGHLGSWHQEVGVASKSKEETKIDMRPKQHHLMDCRASIGYVSAETFQPGGGSCFPILRKDGFLFLITSWHVTGGCLNSIFDVEFPTGHTRPNDPLNTYFSAKLVKFNSAIDISILAVKDRDSFDDLHMFELGKCTYVGQKIWVFGYSNSSQEIKVGDGIVSGEKSSEGDEYLSCTAFINSGTSGGPVIEESGKVVGIATASQFCHDVVESDFVLAWHAGTLVKEYLAQRRKTFRRQVCDVA